MPLFTSSITGEPGLLNTTTSQSLSLTPGVGLGTLSEGTVGSGLGLDLGVTTSDEAARLLEFYNDKTNFDIRELPTRQVHLRRISLLIIKKHH